MKQQQIVILGGGSAGWMTAAALSRFLPQSRYSIVVVESSQIGTVGVGEATIPHIRQFNQWLGIDENEFIQAVGATYKLAIRFQGWGQQDSDYFHPFGYSGEDLNGLAFHQFWLSQRQQQIAPFDHFSMAATMARHNVFCYPEGPAGDPRASFGYAFHMDASLYAQFLKQRATAQGVTCIDGKVTDVRLHQNGEIDALLLDHQQWLGAQLFIDCSGFRGVLIEQSLHSGYDSWQQWLPSDKAIAIPSEATTEPAVYTNAKANVAGWQWRIPLQHRTGNGLVYCSQYLDDDSATDLLLAGLQEQATDTPRQLQFVTGKRKTSWLKNCVAIGLSAGFLEPLESTSLYLIQVAIQKLLEYFPGESVGDVERDAFNQQMDSEYLRVRDFLILHYKLNQRPEPFWQQCANMTVPDSLKERLVMYTETGHVMEYRQGLFQPASWLAVYLGQGQYPHALDARLQVFDPAKVNDFLQSYPQHLTAMAAKMPSHQQALQQAQQPANYPPAPASLYGVKR